MADEPTEVPADAPTRPPEVEEATGIAMHGGYPVNHRLRAEALVADGKTEDPDGHILPDLIADTKDRLERQAKADAEAEVARAAAEPSLDWKRDELAAEAEARGVEVEPAATKATILDALNAAPAAGTEG